MKITKNKGFTLVELLVVITIIGLLATLGIRQFSGAQQKSRDVTRISNIKEIEGAVKQYYTDEQEYPLAKGDGTKPGFSGALSPYIPVLPQDPKDKKPCAGSGADQPACGYVYGVGQDENQMDNMAFELSTAFESEQNLKSKAPKNADQGNDEYRYETGDKYAKELKGNADIDTFLKKSTDPKVTDENKAYHIKK